MFAHALRVVVRAEHVVEDVVSLESNPQGTQEQWADAKCCQLVLQPNEVSGIGGRQGSPPSFPAMNGVRIDLERAGKLLLRHRNGFSCKFQNISADLRWIRSGFALKETANPMARALSLVQLTATPTFKYGAGKWYWRSQILVPPGPGH